MASVTSQTDPEHRIRSTALRHALEIEERKKLQTRIADLVVDAFDLPSNPDADPAHPLASDAALFKQCLGLFQASDLDVLIYERNVDNRCGYALCPKANEKLSHDGQLVWNKKAGKDFKLVDKSELEQWCSTLCQERTVFVRAQLGKEPAWLREVKQVDIKLLDEVGTLDLADSFRVRPAALDQASFRECLDSSRTHFCPCTYSFDKVLTSRRHFHSAKQQKKKWPRGCKHSPSSVEILKS